MRVLILYHSKTGHMLEAANATAEGVRSAGSEVDIVAVTDFRADSIAEYDGLILGSPCWSGSITRSGVAKPIKRAVSAMPESCLEKKSCGGISVHSTTGGAHTVKALGKLLSRKGCRDYRPGPAAKAGVPLSLWKGPSVCPQDEERFKAYGAEFVA
jgi:multimeric flavodoxin WrbA